MVIEIIMAVILFWAGYCSGIIINKIQKKRRNKKRRKEWEEREKVRNKLLDWAPAELGVGVPEYNTELNPVADEEDYYVTESFDNTVCMLDSELEPIEDGCFTGDELIKTGVYKGDKTGFCEDFKAQQKKWQKEKETQAQAKKRLMRKKIEEERKMVLSQWDVDYIGGTDYYTITTNEDNEGELQEDNSEDVD